MKKLLSRILNALFTHRQVLTRLDKLEALLRAILNQGRIMNEDLDATQVALQSADTFVSDVSSDIDALIALTKQLPDGAQSKAVRLAAEALATRLQSVSAKFPVPEPTPEPVPEPEPTV